jgi:rod shape-determining protein MreC
VANLKRPHYIAISLVVLLTLVVLNLPSQTAARLKLALGSLFLPLFGLAGSAQPLASKSVDVITPRSELARQNELLRRENQQLRLQAAQWQEASRENARLRDLLAWQRQSPWKLKLARVVSREPANWWRAVQIDLGSKDGLLENLPVLTQEGLVGRVASVGLTRSQVLLVGDPNCRVSALVDNEKHDQGVLGAAGPLENDLVELTYLPRAVDVKPGQAVVTSGLGGVFPRGIFIGKIVDSRPTEFGLYSQARVKLAISLGALQEVWVLMP